MSEQKMDPAKVFGFGERFFKELTDAEQSAFLDAVTPYFDLSGESREDEDGEGEGGDEDDEEEDDEEGEAELDDEELDAGARVPAAVPASTPGQRPKRKPRAPLPKGQRPKKWPRDAAQIRERLLKLFRGGEELSPKEAVLRLNKSAWAVRLVLWKMFDDGEVTRLGNTNAMKYRLAPADGGQRATS